MKTAVHSIQAVLQHIGYYSGAIDGAFGRLSTAALNKAININDEIALGEILDILEYHDYLPTGMKKEWGIEVGAILHKVFEYPWVDPLKEMNLRTAGLSARGMLFGTGVRRTSSGQPRNHQGVDLAALPGTDLYASFEGVVDYVAPKNSGSYGLSVCIRYTVDDLPIQKKDYIRKVFGAAQKYIYVVYSHLNSTTLSVGDKVRSCQLIGKTGNSGNAVSMTTIARGAHLHLELRSQKGRFGGMSHRADPLPLFDKKLSF